MCTFLCVYMPLILAPAEFLMSFSVLRCSVYSWFLWRPILQQTPSWITAFWWWGGLRNSVKLWASPRRATRDRQVVVKSSDKTWSTWGGNGKPLQCSCRENPMSSMERRKDRTLEDEPPRLEGVQYVPREEQRAVTDSSRKNEAAGPNQKWHSGMDVSGGES